MGEDQKTPPPTTLDPPPSNIPGGNPEYITK